MMSLTKVTELPRGFSQVSGLQNARSKSEPPGLPLSTIITSQRHIDDSSCAAPRYYIFIAIYLAH